MAAAKPLVLEEHLLRPTPVAVSRFKTGGADNGLVAGTTSLGLVEKNFAKDIKSLQPEFGRQTLPPAWPAWPYSTPWSARGPILLKGPMDHNHCSPRSTTATDLPPNPIRIPRGIQLSRSPTSKGYAGAHSPSSETARKTRTSRLGRSHDPTLTPSDGILSVVQMSLMTARLAVAVRAITPRGRKS